MGFVAGIAVYRIVMVAGHDFQPRVVRHPQVRQHHGALDRVRANGVLLGLVGPLGLGSQLVLQGGHGHIHGERRVDQAVALSRRQLQLGAHQVAQNRTDQCVRGAVPDRRIAGQLKQQVQAHIRVALQQALHPPVVLHHPVGKLLCGCGAAQNDAQAGLQVRPLAQQVFVSVFVSHDCHPLQKRLSRII